MDFYRPPTTRGTLEALSSLYRTVQVWRFYPKGHPSLRNSLNHAHTALKQLLDGHTLLLACGRAGFSFPDGELLKDSSGITTTFSYELLIRRAQKITFSHDIFPEDLLELCKLICLTPEQIQQAGGIDTLMAERGIRSVWVNEFDLSVIRGKRQRVEESGIVPPGLDEAEIANNAFPATEQAALSEELSPEQQLQVLLGRLSTCSDDDIYLILVRQAVAFSEIPLISLEPHLLFPLLELFAEHAGDAAHSENQREYAHFALEQLIASDSILRGILERANRDDLSNETLCALLKAGGTTAISTSIELMGRTSSLRIRKKLATAITCLGEDALPLLLDLLHDQRWFITRNICSILGAIASRDALPELTMCLHHPDIRVRKEAIRSLAQIGGPVAEEAIINILTDKDSGALPQAIISLGGMKSRRAVAELMIIMFSRDLFLQSLSLKIGILTALASIGDRQVTPFLITLLNEHYFLAPTRGRKLKTAIVECLGKLGDPGALPILNKLASENDELGSACSRAIALIEKTEGRSDGNY
jgi:HEAT repeat protein